MVVPTETAYGLCVDATHARAVRRLVRMKKRSASKGISVFVTSEAMLQRYAVWTPIAEKLWDVFLPGPLTLVVPTRARAVRPLASPIVRRGSVGVRVSPHPLVRTLVKRIGHPLTATSANVSGEGALYRADDVVASFARHRLRPDMLIDAGKLPTHKTSTVVDCTHPKSVRLLRKGAIPEREILRALL